MAEQQPVPTTPSRCGSAFQALVDVADEDRSVALATTLHECSLEEWHQANLRYEPQRPVEHSRDDPQAQLAELCSLADQVQSRVCREAG